MPSDAVKNVVSSSTTVKTLEGAGYGSLLGAAASVALVAALAPPVVVPVLVTFGSGIVGAVVRRKWRAASDSPEHE